jgi:hypothetical protein
VPGGEALTATMSMRYFIDTEHTVDEHFDEGDLRGNRHGRER